MRVSLFGLFRSTYLFSCYKPLNTKTLLSEINDFRSIIYYLYFLIQRALFPWGWLWCYSLALWRSLPLPPFRSRARSTESRRLIADHISVQLCFLVMYYFSLGSTVVRLNIWGYYSRSCKGCEPYILIVRCLYLRLVEYFSLSTQILTMYFCIVGWWDIYVTIIISSVFLVLSFTCFVPTPVVESTR